MFQQIDYFLNLEPIIAIDFQFSWELVQRMRCNGDGCGLALIICIYSTEWMSINCYIGHQTLANPTKSQIYDSIAHHKDYCEAIRF